MKLFNKNIKTSTPIHNSKGIITAARILPFVFMVVLIWFCGCKKFLIIPAPSSQLVTSSVLNNNATATSAVTVIYAQMFSNAESPNSAQVTGLLGDELIAYATSSASAANFQEYTNSMVATGTYGPWTTAYNYIYQANAIISGLQNTAGCSPAVKQQLTGESYFIRAFWHFYLSNCYGDLPIVTTTDYSVTDKLVRSPRVQVLKQVIADLKTAQSLLSSNYVDASDTLVTTERVRPNQAVATALLARAYLYMGNYSKDASQYPLAEAAATTVINSSTYSLSPLTGFNEVFSKNSMETIWQLQTPMPATTNTLDGNKFILLAAPSTAQVSMNTQLLNSFEPNDQRKINWINSITAVGKTYYYPFKYKIQTGGTTITEYTMVFRLAEQYLIRAEARAEQGSIANALADLNAIRNRAGLPNYPGQQDQTSVLAAILHERQVELFTEWGHRWFDLQRTGVAGATMSLVTPLKGGVWNSDGHQQLFPIPQADILKDINLTQNVGY